MFIDRRRPFDSIYVSEAAMPEIANAHKAFVERDLERGGLGSVTEQDMLLLNIFACSFLVSEVPYVTMTQRKTDVLDLEAISTQSDQYAAHFVRYTTLFHARLPVCMYDTYIDDDNEVQIARYDYDALKVIAPEVFSELPIAERDVVITEEAKLGINGLRFSLEEITEFAEDARDARLIMSL